MIRIMTVTMIGLAAMWCVGCEERGSAKEAATASAGAKGPGLVPLAISLPKPMFKCTPYPIPRWRAPNLEERSWRRRGPFLVPPGTTNIALGKPVTSNDPEPIIGELELITDSEKRSSDGNFVEVWGGEDRCLRPLPTWVQIDLQGEFAIYAVLVWRWQRVDVYQDVVVQISSDPDFVEGVVTVFNNDHDNTSGFGIGHEKAYIETYQGKLIDCKGFAGRYVRLYSRGSLRQECNQYVEVEAHGRSVDALPSPIDQPLPKLEIDVPPPAFH